MRPWVPLVLAFAGFIASQGSNNNVINNPSSGIQATAGQPLTITWANPSSGTVTIKIQTSGDIQPTDGIVVAQNVANTGSATFNIPADVPVGQVFVQIIDDTNPSDYNFSGGFQVQGATNTASLAASTASAASSSISASSSNSASSASRSSVSASASSSSASESMSTSMSMSSESASSSSASASSASSASSSSSSSSSRNSSISSSLTASRTVSSSATAQSTIIPSSAAVMPVKVQGGLLAAVLGAAALL